MSEVNHRLRAVVAELIAENLTLKRLGAERKTNLREAATRRKEVNTGKRKTKLVKGKEGPRTGAE